MGYVVFIRRDVFSVEPGLRATPLVGPDPVAFLESVDVLANIGNDSSAVATVSSSKLTTGSRFDF